ncbi:MAG: type II toxin-antitoxin system RelE/ParE family toxin [Pyrinomonadaceae bacterium]
MSFKVQVRRAAELDVAEAQVWYETQRSGLGAEFHSEISQIFTVLSETPLIYPVLHRDVRRVLVHRFPYLVWYRVVGEEVTVLACTHVRQNPEKVISRLR